MTKQELKSYRMIERSIESKTKEIESYRTSDCVLSSVEFPYSQHLVTVRGAPPDDDGSRWELIRERAELIAKRREIWRYVHRIPDPITRRIFELRYLEGYEEPTWRDIALRIGGGNGESSVRMLCERYLKRS